MKRTGNTTKINSSSPKKNKGCCKCHMNSLGSLGYCIITLGLTAFIITTEVQQLFKYLSLPWPDGEEPRLELNLHIGLVGAATVLVPFFFGASVYKIGNFANDGFRLGVHDSTCSRDPSPLPVPSGGLLKGAWRHGGPTSPFIHLIISHALLIARLVMEAAIIRKGFLPRSTVWSSELAFLLPQQERISILDRLEFYSNIETPPTRSDVSGVFETSSSLVFTDASDDLSSSNSNIVNNNSNNNSNKNNKNSTSFTMGTDKSLFDVTWNKGVAWNVGEIPWGPFTPHFLNYVLAHLVYAGRYAGVFWGTSKGLGFLVFLQLILNAAQNVISINGFQVLYKVQVVGFSQRVLPVEEGFIMPFLASVALYCASQTLVLASGSVIYLYGYSKFQSFLSAEREKYHILSKHGHETMWPYWPHCWSLTVLVLMTGSLSPLIYDWTVVYRASLDTATLAATCGTVAHLFLWILLWMGLTLKSQWHFKLRVQISKTVVSNSHSIRLVNEVQLSQQAEESEGPVMVIGSGKTYLLQEDSPKRALMKLVLTTLTEKKARGEEEEIYWLRPKGPSTDGSSWGKKKASPGVKHKVTFHEDAGEGSSTKEKYKKKKLPMGSDGGTESDSSIDSDGDYACLRNVSFPGPTLSIVKQGAPGPHLQSSLQVPTSLDADTISVGAEFPAPPPELTNPAHYPPPPDSPPPPLPVDDLSRLTSSSTPSSPHKGRVKNPIINVVRGDSVEGNGVARDSGLLGDCPDSSSTSSSVTPPDKRSDSGVHSQTSTGSHSKSGSSGSESCVPPPAQQNCQRPINESPEALPPPPPTTSTGVHRCSSVDELCSLPPLQTVQALNVKSYSLQHGASASDAYQYQQMQSNHHDQQIQQYQRLQYEAHHQQAYQQQQSHNNNNSTHQQNNNERIQHNSNPTPPCNTSAETSSNKGRLSIEVVGGGYGFLPPSKFVASEPVYSDASTPVAIRRRSSITAVEPETPPYERSSASFSTFTEPPLPRAVLRGATGMHQALSAVMPGKAMTVGAAVYRARRPPSAEAKHATITGAALPKGFHQPGHMDSRYFSVPAVKPQGIRIYPAPEMTPPLTNNLIHK